jgi:hypothetical protein
MPAVMGHADDLALELGLVNACAAGGGKDVFALNPLKKHLGYSCSWLLIGHKVLL